MSHTIHNPTDEELLTRLRKIEGQVRGLQRMIERDEPCIDIITQIASARAALSAVGLGLVDCGFRRTVRDGQHGGLDAAVTDMLVAVELFVDR
jgi:CsoR family transcriptional regulator, copper-sensing transcriptional repressor